MWPMLVIVGVFTLLGGGAGYFVADSKLNDGATSVGSITEAARLARWSTFETSASLPLFSAFC